MNNLHAGTLVGDGGHVKIGKGVVQVEKAEKPNYASPNPRVGPGVPVGGIAGRANMVKETTSSSVDSHVYVQQPRVKPPRAPVINPPMGGVRNQFNITGSTIGQVAIGNQGKTVFNNKTEHYHAGSHRSDYAISGGNFAQANIGGQATYNNQNTTIGEGGVGGPLSIDDLLYSDGVAEGQLIEILKKGMSTASLAEVLRSGRTIKEIHSFVSQQKEVKDYMVTSMLAGDGTKMEISESDTSDSDSD
nr:uncharacterized protein LOC120329665 isoform X2 [Styela clava]